jgi:hypothetical protein
VLISEEELERLHKRFRYPRFSKVEYERRYNNIRKLMRESNLDCLLDVDVMAPSTEHIPALIKARDVTILPSERRFRRRTRTDKSTGPLTTISHTLLAQLLCAGEFKAAIDLYAYRLADLKLTPDDAVQYDKPYQ